MIWCRLGRLGAVAMMAGILAAPAAAQDQTDGGAPSLPPSQVDGSKLLNLARVQRQLQRTIEREQLNGTTLRYNIDVFARSPRIELFAPDVDLQFGPVPFSAPTHQDMLNIVTPQEFRSPVMDFSNLLRWLQNRSRDRNDSSR
jgi:hypothetical protein